jgi:hypothetical protein
VAKQDRFKQELDADGEHPLLNSYIHKERKLNTPSNVGDGGLATSAYADMAASAGKAATARRMVENAHGAKVNATEAWVNGHISSKQHAEVHAKANHVLKNAKHLAGRTDALGSKEPAGGKRVAGGYAGAKPHEPKGNNARAAARRTNKAGQKQQGKY